MTRSRCRGSLATRSRFIPRVDVSCDLRMNDITSIRVMFSIADIQNVEEPEYEQEEGESEESDPAQSYPIRVSFSITKVCFIRRVLFCICLTEMSPV
jgi:hypothetical protein